MRLVVIVVPLDGMNLPADLAPRKICRVYVGIGGVGRDRVGDRVEIVGRYILPRYRKDIVQRDRSRHRCSRTRGRASRRDCRHLRWRGLGRRLAQPDDDAAGITRLAKVDMSLLHVRSEGTRIGQRICDRSLLFIEIEAERACGVGQDGPGVAGGRGRAESRHRHGSRYRSDFVEPRQMRSELLCARVTRRERNGGGSEGGCSDVVSAHDFLPKSAVFRHPTQF